MPSWMLRTQSEAACFPLTYFSKYTPGQAQGEGPGVLRAVDAVEQGVDVVCAGSQQGQPAQSPAHTQKPAPFHPGPPAYAELSPEMEQATMPAT